jgi:hypothetical protein
LYSYNQRNLSFQQVSYTSDGFETYAWDTLTGDPFIYNGTQVLNFMEVKLINGGKDAPKKTLEDLKAVYIQRRLALYRYIRGEDGQQ